MLTAGPLTLKHIEASGREHIIQAISVEFYLEAPVVSPVNDTGSHLIAHGVPLIPGSADTGGVAHFADGTVYVMNEAGSTVGRYALGQLGLRQAA